MKNGNSEIDFFHLINSISDIEESINNIRYSNNYKKIELLTESYKISGIATYIKL